MVITNRTKYLERIISLLSDSMTFIQLSIDESKCISYIINLENRLKNCFKVLKNDEKISVKECVLAQLELHPAFNKVSLKYIKNSLTALQNFDLIYQQ